MYFKNRKPPDAGIKLSYVQDKYSQDYSEIVFCFKPLFLNDLFLP